ncbi:MAG: acyl carrier protein [Clostridia bacterium]|jgi:acyl carrier protein|nr:acyl carrier protein [Clostridia bacterium]MBO7398696.1 acyl carrier protein [Clostridia bacterium]MBO7504500.1 acyl carrier protein [Clostridia bacterium]MBO7659437.1 acyl carrier protein [Clostridia bacterium]MBP5665347.1 acyl carrier protein [Clostridia bacterium]
MFESVKKLLTEQLRLKDVEITRDSRIKEDLKADSLDVLQLLMTIEEEYNIMIPDEKLAGFKTVGDVVDYLETLK